MNIAKSPTNLIAQDTLSTHQDLHSQLMALRFDDSFLPRLLRETGWTIEQCDRTLQEYRRFLFLHRTANHTVIPSQMVDKVWHLHLLYTRSYWEDLCHNILKTPLHHHPGSATGDQRNFFWGNYEATLKSYETTFHHCPPADIWPEPARQFAHPKNKPDHWQIPKPKLPKLPSIEIHWLNYFALPPLAYAVAIILRADSLTNLVSILKYGLICISIVNLIKFIVVTKKNFKSANRISGNSFRIDPRTRQESNPTQSIMEYQLIETQIKNNMYAIIAFSTGLFALYVQIDQKTGISSFIRENFKGEGTPILLIGITFLSIRSIYSRINSSMENILKKKLEYQDGRMMHVRRNPNRCEPDHINRPTLCKGCERPIAKLHPNIVNQLLTKEELNANSLNTIDIFHHSYHCTTCSPRPDRKNLSFRVSPKRDYSICSKCNIIARKTTIKTLQTATISNEGKELVSEDCAYCQDHSEQIRSIPQLVSSSCDCCD
jgi:hypothetical protein